LGAERSVRIVAFHNVNLDRGGFGNGWNAIFQQARMGGEPVEIVRLLAQRLPHAHPYGTFYLSLHGEGIDRVSAVERGPDVLERDQAGCLMAARFNDVSGIAESHGRADGAAAVFSALRLRWTAEGSGDRDGAAADERSLCNFVERKARLPRCADIKGL